MGRKKTKPEMSDTEYQEFEQLLHYDAASLRALALWMNAHKKNSALMKATSAEMGRNARHLARAVEYFPAYFLDESVAEKRTAHEYLMLFEYAKRKREDATTLFAIHKFNNPLWKLREIIAASDPKRERAKCDDGLEAKRDAVIDTARKLTNVYDTDEHNAAMRALIEAVDALDAAQAAR